MRIDEHRYAFRYNRWANARTFDAVAALEPAALERDVGTSFGSILETLRHVLAAEWVWLQRWNGSSPAGIPDAWRTLDLAGIARELDAIAEGQALFLEGLEESRLDVDICYRDTRGNKRRFPLWRLLRHLVNHSSYHRGQVTTMLRQAGADAASTDMVLFDDGSS